MSLNDSLDILHQTRQIEIQKVLDDIVETLDELIPALLDLGAPLELVTKGQMLLYLVSHIEIQQSTEVEGGSSG